MNTLQRFFNSVHVHICGLDNLKMSLNAPFFYHFTVSNGALCFGPQEKEMEKQKILYQQARLHARGAAEMVLQMISASKGKIMRESFCLSSTEPK